MAHYRAVTEFHSTTGLDEDNSINVLHFETVEANPLSATAALLAAHVEAAYTDDQPGAIQPMAAWLAQCIRGGASPITKIYGGPTGGSPIFTDEWDSFPAGLDMNSFPSEVAYVLSFAGDLTGVPEEAADGIDAGTAPDRPAMRRRGRIFIGPISPAAGGSVVNRPQTGIKDSALGFAGLLGDFDAPLTALGARWIVYSPTDGLGHPVVTARVDDAWDTQRRRGVAATERFSVVVTQP